MMHVIVLEAQGFARFSPTDDLFKTLGGDLEYNASGIGGPPPWRPAQRRHPRRVPRLGADPEPKQSRASRRRSVSRSRTLAERSAFTDDPRDAAIAVFERLGPKRARVQGVSVRAGTLVDAADAPQQLSLDPGREVSRLLDPVVDRQCPLRAGPCHPGARSPTAAEAPDPGRPRVHDELPPHDGLRRLRTRTGGFCAPPGAQEGAGQYCLTLPDGRRAPERRGSHILRLVPTSPPAVAIPSRPRRPLPQAPARTPGREPRRPRQAPRM